MPVAIPYYKKAKTSKIIGFALLVPAITLAFIARPDNTLPRKDNVGYSVAGLISSTASVYFLLRFRKNINKAIHRHNEHVMKMY